MARNKPKGKPQFNTKFIRYTLNADDKKRIPEYTKREDKNLDALVTEVLGANHKISWSFNPNNDTYICTFTGKSEDCVNADLCYTSFAATPWAALWVALYKYFEIWEGSAWQDLEEGADFG